jgi:hypothetical protein
MHKSTLNAEEKKQFEAQQKFPKTVRSTGNDITMYFGNEDFIVECYYTWKRKDQEVLEYIRRYKTAALQRGLTPRQAAAGASGVASKAGRMSGSFGNVYKLKVGAHNYFIKAVVLSPSTYVKQRSMALNELTLAVKLTILAPDAVSNGPGVLIPNT